MLNRRPISLFAILAIYLGLLAGAARAAGVVGTGTPARCTDAALATALAGGALYRFTASSVTANNGGPTQTLLPLAGSLAIDAGSNTGCPTLDQRGGVRPRNGGSGFARCDIGAVEVPEPAGAVALAAGVVALAGLARPTRRA